MQNQTDSHLHGPMEMLSAAFSAVFAIADQNFRHIHFATDQVEGISIVSNSFPGRKKREKKVRVELVNLKLKGNQHSRSTLRFRVPTVDSDKEINMFLNLDDIKFDISNSEETPFALTMAFKKVYEELTFRERQVMVLVSEGFTSKKISNELKISEPTVKNHRKHAKKKIQKVGSQNEVKFLSWLANHLGEQNGRE